MPHQILMRRFFFHSTLARLACDLDFSLQAVQSNRQILPSKRRIQNPVNPVNPVYSAFPIVNENALPFPCSDSTHIRPL